MGIHSLPARRWGRLGLVGLLGVTLALIGITTTVRASGAPGTHRIAATVAKKKCKKGKKSATAAKKKKCKRKKHVVVPPVTPPAPAPTPQTLSNQEIIDRITAKALEYGQDDPDFNGNYGYWSDDMAGFIPHCRTKGNLIASCEGYWEWDDGVNEGECDFYEVVERDGLTGIKSHLDTDYDVDGFTDGVDCYTFV
jgi:hypothetical protein